MDTLTSFLSSLGILVIGLVVRLLVFFALLTIFSLPILVVVAGIALRSRARERALGTYQEGGFRFRGGVFYSPGHLWMSGGIRRMLTLGLDDLAQRLFTDVQAVVLPDPGTEVREGEPLATIVSGGKSTMIPAPVAGVVVEGNREVVADPSLLHREPYRKGWLLALRPADARFRWALRGQPALAWLRAENTRLVRVLEGELGLEAADGGELAVPPAAALSDEQWRMLTRTFLKAA